MIFSSSTIRAANHKPQLAKRCLDQFHLPQVIKTWQSKSASDLSWSMLIILCAGIILWLWYGFIVQDIPIIAANIVTFLLASVILALKIRYQK